MKYILANLLFLTFSISGKAQLNISLPETVDYVNTILETNTKDRWCVNKMDADKYGNVKFYCAMRQYWFNINDAEDINISDFFVFSVNYKIKCSSGNECDMSTTKKDGQTNSCWPFLYGGFQFSKLSHEDLSRLIKAFKHLKTLTKDPFN